MKKPVAQLHSLVVLLFLFHITSFAQNIGINSTGAAPNSEALLDIDAAPGNNKGFLMPRLTTAQRDAMGATTEGLQIYNLDCHTINYYNGAVWVPIGNTGSVTTPGAITGNTTVAENATGETYSIAAVTGATGYNWTVPTGASITAGQGTTTITVTFGTADGNVCVTANNACGTSNSSCEAITITSNCFDGTTAIVTVTSAGVECGWTETLAQHKRQLLLLMHWPMATYTNGADAPMDTRVEPALPPV